MLVFITEIRLYTTIKHKQVSIHKWATSPALQEALRANHRVPALLMMSTLALVDQVVMSYRNLHSTILRADNSLRN